MLSTAVGNRDATHFLRRHDWLGASDDGRAHGDDVRPVDVDVAVDAVAQGAARRLPPATASPSRWPCTSRVTCSTDAVLRAVDGDGARSAPTLTQPMVCCQPLLLAGTHLSYYVTATATGDV